jgi:hypothetical protein
MTTDQPVEQREDLPVRLSENFYFQVSWLIFLGLMITFVGWPIRNIVLVWWVYGTDAYFHEGVRVLKGKPIRFSNGELAPTLPDFVTGFGAFFVTTVGLTVLLIFVLRLYEGCFPRK